MQLIKQDYEFKLSSVQLEKDKSDDRLKGYEKQRDEIIKENNRLRSLIVESEGLKSELEKEQEKNRELYRKCHKIETELSSNTSIEQELTEMNMKLKNELLFHTQEVQKFKDQIHRLREEYENRLVEIRTQHLAEKNELSYKYEETSSKLKRAMEKINDAKKLHEKKKKQYQTYAKAIKVKAEALNAKVKELKIKEQQVKQMVPLHAYNKLKMQLNAFCTRHQAFRDMILNGTPTLSGANQVNFFKNLQTQAQNLEKQLFIDLNSNNDFSNDHVVNSFMKETSVKFNTENLLKTATSVENENRNDLVSLKKNY